MTDTTELDDATIDPAAAELRELIRTKYAGRAQRVQNRQRALGHDDTGASDEPVAVDDRFGAAGYGEQDKAELPEAALLASIGCGNPLMVADLRPGEIVLDLGSGGGIDVLLSARRVGPTGKAYGLDMADEMLELARHNAAEAGATNVEFLRGHIEDIPLPADAVDVIISNCVINLSVDKPAVFAAMNTVLRPGGRVGISDIIADDDLSQQDRLERGRQIGCLAGVLSESEYRNELAIAGFTDITLDRTRTVSDRMHSAIVKAVNRKLGVGI